MQKHLSHILAAVSATATFLSSGQPATAIISGRFRSVDEIATADNLLIIRVPNVVQPIQGLDGVMDYEVEVLSVLRGPKPTDPRHTVISTTSVLKPGSRYLLAGKPASRGGKPWLLFHWTLGVVEIPSKFRLSSLVQQSIKDQVTAILRARRAAVIREMKVLQEEKGHLDRVLPFRAEDAVSRAKPVRSTN